LASFAALLVLLTTLGGTSVVRADQHEEGEPEPQAETDRNDATDTQTTNLLISVVNSATGEPVTSARVIIRPVAGSTSFEQRTDTTNDDGSCIATGLPSGKVKVVVTASNMRSFKKEYAIDTGKQKVVIKLVPTEDPD
jgi:hypothetical protein